MHKTALHCTNSDMESEAARLAAIDTIHRKRLCSVTAHKNHRETQSGKEKIKKAKPQRA